MLVVSSAAPILCAALGAAAIVAGSADARTALPYLALAPVAGLVLRQILRDMPNVGSIAVWASLLGLVAGVGLGSAALGFGGSPMHLLVALQMLAGGILISVRLIRSMQSPSDRVSPSKYPAEDIIDVFQRRFGQPSRDATIAYIQTLPDHEKDRLNQEMVDWVRSFDRK